MNISSSTEMSSLLFFDSDTPSACSGVVHLTVEARCRDRTDTAEQFADEPLAETLADLAYHCFWRSEEEGWRYWVPRFVVGWQYDRSWTRTVLEAIELFAPTFSQAGQHRLQRMMANLNAAPDPEDTQTLLAELEKLGQRGWVEGFRAAEYRAILQFQKGQLQYRQERYPDALQHYFEAERHLPQTALKLQHQLADAFREVGWKFALKRFIAVPSEEAKAAFSKAVNLDPANGHNLVALGVAQHGLKQHSEAVESLTNGIALLEEPQTDYALNWLGNALKAQQRLDDAIAAYEKAIELDPNYAYAYNNLGNALADQQQLDKAIAAYEKAIDLNSDYANAYNGLGTALADQQQLDKAIAAYEKAIQLDPEYAAAYNNLGNALKAQQRLDDAIAAYEKAIDLNPEEAAAYNNLGIALKAQQQLDKAIAAYEKAIDLNSEYATAYNNLGNALQAQQQWDQAIAAYEKAIDLNPEEAAAYNNLGIALQAQQQWDQAIAAYEKAIDLNPEEAAAYNNLGDIYDEQARYEEAVTVYQKAIELAPGNASYYRDLGKAYAELGLNDKAILAYQKAIELNPTKANFHNSLGWLYLLQDDLVQARETFAAAIDLDSEAYWPVLNLGLVDALEGKVAEARQRWEMGLSLCQGEDDWKQAIRALYAVALGEVERGMAELQAVIQAGASVGALRNVLGDAEVLARCPVPMEGMGRVVELLRQAVEEIVVDR